MGNKSSKDNGAEAQNQVNVDELSQNTVFGESF